YRPGSHGESLAGSYLKACRKARRNLAGIGSESWGNTVVVWLVDPFTDPATGDTVVEGSVIDDSANEIWMAVSPEAPPEDPHRPMILLFGAALPAGADLDLLLEGFGLHLAGTEQAPDALAGLQMPPLEHASGDLRTAMALSWVRFLLARENEDIFRQLLASPAGQVESRFQELYGTTSTALEMQWHYGAIEEQHDVKAGEFLRLSLKYLKPYKARQAEIFVYMLLSLAFTAAFPFVSRRLFDDALPSGEFGQVATLLGLLGGAFVVSLLAGLRQTYQSAWVSGAVVRDIRAQMFDRLQRLPEAWHSRYQQGDVLSRMFNDVGQVENGLTTAIGTGIFQGLQLVVSGIIMLTVNFWLGVLVLLGAPIVAFVYKRMAKGAQARSVAVSEASSDLLGVASENNAAGQVVRMFGLAGREGDRFGRASERLFGAERRLSLFGGFFGLSVNLIVTLLRLAVMGIGAWLIIEGRFTIGGLVAFLGVMGDVLTPVTSLTTLGQGIQASMGSLVRINEVLDATPEGADDSGKTQLKPLERDITLTGVAFSYGPEKRVLDGVDCTIEAGTKVAFVGPSGSGKSTVLRLLMRQWDPEEGAILFDGTDIRTATLASLRDQMGVVFQDPFLFDTTVRENIAMGRPGATEAEIIAAAEAAEIDSFIGNLPRGYDTLVGQRGSNLSGGQRQRVSIARALVRNPSILLLDEATSALDPQTERAINQTLDRVAHKRTVISITHRLTSVTGYDKIFVVDNGSIVESGSHEQLVAMGGLYAHLWSEQTGAPVERATAFDAVSALAKVSLFADLGPEALAGVAARLTTFDLAAGETIAEGGGRLLLIA
ncbi:MAG: ABC transporter ATP-binding protein, partial [Acidimicrobiales bacterium]|nr:ABC transporter ATP-binding protein [Acidimicrobiales bacterium]